MFAVCWWCEWIEIRTVKCNVRVSSALISQAHQQCRKADRLLAAGKYEEAISCHRKAAGTAYSSHRFRMIYFFKQKLLWNLCHVWCGRLIVECSVFTYVRLVGRCHEAHQVWTGKSDLSFLTRWSPLTAFLWGGGEGDWTGYKLSTFLQRKNL